MRKPPKFKKLTSPLKATKQKYGLGLMQVVLSILVIFAIGLSLYRSFTEPSSINLIDNSENDSEFNIPSETNTMLPRGCTYHVVQCATAPCPPILICASLDPIRQPVCTQEAGSCIGNNGVCTGYRDGCQKAKLCAQPIKTCGIPPIVSPSPFPKSVPGKPVPLPKASLAPTKPTTIAKISATEPCGMSSYGSYDYLCQNATAGTLAPAQCLEFTSAYDQIYQLCTQPK